MLNISSLLVKRLIKENTIEYFNIIFKSFKFFDSGFIINILFIHYKNKQPMSVSNSNEQISKNNFRKKKKNPYDSIHMYLWEACSIGNKYMVKYLVEHGMDTNKANREGQSPLFKACETGNEYIVKYIVEHGADISIKPQRGETPLFYACKNKNVNIVKYLMENGVDINKHNNNGDTSLF